MLESLYLITALGAFVGGLTQTIIDDLKYCHIKDAQQFQSFPDNSRDMFTKGGSDECKPRAPLIPDLSRLETLSEVKCKQYIWDVKNRDEEAVRESLCIKRDKPVPVKITPVIYGGRPAENFEFPHMGAVGWRSNNVSKKWEFKCGSTLISEKFLLTAGHCSKISIRLTPDIANSSPEVVVLGFRDISQFSTRAKIENIERIIVHPEYNPPIKYNDIAIIMLEKAVTFSSNILPACVWPHGLVTGLGKEFSVTGWGYTEKGTPSSVLQTAQVAVLDSVTCDGLLQGYRNRNWQGFTDDQICAGNLQGGIDTCQGDSGGPLQVKLPTSTNEPMYMVIGITSFGIKCGVKNQPGVYTKVSSYIDWIEENVWDNNQKDVVN